MRARVIDRISISSILGALIPLPDVGATLQGGIETSPRTVFLYDEN